MIPIRSIEAHPFLEVRHGSLHKKTNPPPSVYGASVRSWSMHLTFESAERLSCISSLRPQALSGKEKEKKGMRTWTRR
jgi:hypothetical protein